MKEIGGYFELEITDHGGFLHDDAYLLNCCHNALALVLTSRLVSKVHVPYYTCDSVIRTISSLNIPFSFYSIDKNLEIASDIELYENEFLLYTNYFGIKDSYVKVLAAKYSSNLIVDNAQAFFSERLPGICSVYSTSKFFGVPDGGMAYLNNIVDTSNWATDTSYDRCAHLLMRCDLQATEAYSISCDNRSKTNNTPISHMSKLTKHILRGIDYDKVKTTRLNNFHVLHNSLQETNLLTFGISDISVPLVYPYMVDNMNIRANLLENRIYVAKYWPAVLTRCSKDQIEVFLTNHIIPLPIDQRYGKEDMHYILQTLNKI